MRVSRFVFFLSLCFFSAQSFGQTDSLQRPNRFIRFNYDNDFFSATDRYYTQGVYLDVILPVFKRTLLAKTLISLKNSSENNYGISLVRQGFTPRSIRHEGLFIGERPFAAVSYLSHTLVSTAMNKKLRLSCAIDLGIMGPNSRGAEEQKGIHYALANIQPLGWENQIENDYVVNYDVAIEKGILNRRYFEVVFSADVRMGTLYDDFGAGALLRFGKMHSYFSDPGMTRDKSAEKFQCYVFVKGKGKVVGYNATMQGGMINRNSIYTISAGDIERFVGLVNYGIVIAYKRFGVEYSKTNISPEFRNGLYHGWGRVGLNYCF